MPPKPNIIPFGKIIPKMRPAALLARQRTLHNQPRHRMQMPQLQPIPLQLRLTTILARQKSLRLA